MTFTHEHEQLRRTVERFCREEINPHYQAWEEAGIYPAHDVFRKLGDLGLLGLTKPAAVGGAELDYS
jgi:citronellyl-CoA dehydrogenase